MSGDFSEFTESNYREVLAEATSRYSFERYGTTSAVPHALWRHDVDFSVHRAVRLAQFEAEAGVVSTYFLLFHSTFYNLLERGIADRARALVRLGHDVGLHFDSAFYNYLPGGDVDTLYEHIAVEAEQLEMLVEAPVRVFAFHNPGVVNDDLAIGDDEVAGLVNAYGRRLRENYEYVSDANGFWRFRPLVDVLRSGAERIHVVTHPEWWQAEPMAPRQRIVRCTQGRAEWMLRDYDELLARSGRQNIG